MVWQANKKLGKVEVFINLNLNLIVTIECALCEHSIVMNQMVGVLFGLTDYAYWLYVTDTEGNIDI